MPTIFASGKHAFGFCDICGQRYKLSKLKTTIVKTKPTNLLACPTCWDPDHPQLRLGMQPISDPQALKNPRPEAILTISRYYSYGWNPVGGGNDLADTPNPLKAEASVGDVEVTT